MLGFAKYFSFSGNILTTNSAHAPQSRAWVSILGLTKPHQGCHSKGLFRLRSGAEQIPFCSISTQRELLETKRKFWNNQFVFVTQKSTFNQARKVIISFGFRGSIRTCHHGAKWTTKNPRLLRNSFLSQLIQVQMSDDLRVINFSQWNLFAFFKDKYLPELSC